VPVLPAMTAAAGFFEKYSLLNDKIVPCDFLM
jgi:hypothetical protein